MICIKCNKEIEDGTKFCTHCGTVQESSEEKAPNVINVTPAVKEKTEKKAEEAKPKGESAKTTENSENATLPEPKNEKPVKKEEKGPKKKKEKAPKEKKEKAPKEQKEIKPKKSKDRVNFFLLLLTLCCPPYFGVLITICKSAKAPKASQVYGVFTILSFIFMKIKNYILTVVATFCVIMAALAVVLQGAYLVLAELGYDITFVTNFISGLFNF